MQPEINYGQLIQKWQGVLSESTLPKITDVHRLKTTALLLENQANDGIKTQMLHEAAPSSFIGTGPASNSGGNNGIAATYDPILIGLVRRTAPQLIAYDVCGVQPMNGPSGLVFAMKSRYVDNGNTTISNRPEALYNEANTAWSGTGSQAGSNPVDATTGLQPWDLTPADDYTTGTGMDTATAEGITPAEMSLSIEKMTVTAKSRTLKAEYSIELQQDLRQIHGLDADSELTNMLANEITAETNREIVRTMYRAAKTGCEAGTTNATGVFDLDLDSNGRWSVERFKGLIFQIEREANRIAQTTRRGRGNFLIVSADVASALSMTNLLDTSNAISAALNVDDSTTTFAGILNGKYKVFIDPYSANGSPTQFMMVGYKGASPWDAGIYYCPYVPLQLLRGQDPDTFQPKVGFKTRYGIVGHPFAAGSATVTDSTGLALRSNNFFRLSQIKNIA